MDKLRVAFFPNSAGWDQNPYYIYLRQALTEAGITFVAPPNDFLSSGWLIAQRRNVDLLHFHWLQYHYAFLGPDKGSGKALLKFLAKVALARLLGYRIIWAMHNALPHEPSRAGLDRWAYRGMARLAHAVLLLCPAGKGVLQALTGRRQGVYVTGLGSYPSLPPNLTMRNETRQILAVKPEQTLFLFFGSIRPYKGIAELIACFAQLPPQKFQLLVAGKPGGGTDVSALQQAAAPHPHIHLRLEFMPETTLNSFLQAADAAVFPFRHILASSSVVQAMGAGLPVITPALGCLPDWVPPDGGIVYSPIEPGSLKEAINNLAGRNLQPMGAAAKAYADKLSWAAVADATKRAYDGE